MEEQIYTMFKNALLDCEEVRKDDLIRFADECGFVIPKKIAKEKVVNTIIDKGFRDRLYEEYKEFVYIPFWEIADFYGVASNRIDLLRQIGFINEAPKVKEFYSRRDKNYFNADTYCINLLEQYSKEQVLKTIESALGGKFKIRIETKTKEKVQNIVNSLLDVFEVIEEPNSYEHRNNDGFYSYFSLRPLNGSTEESNRLTYEIARLKQKLKDQEQQHQEERIKSRDKIFDIFGVNDIFSLKQIKEDAAKYEVNVNKLNSLQEHNSRRAGRKGKFTDADIVQIEMMSLRGDSQQAIANFYGVSRQTINKYLKDIKKC